MEDKTVEIDPDAYISVKTVVPPMAGRRVIIKGLISSPFLIAI